MYNSSTASGITIRSNYVWCELPCIVSKVLGRAKRDALTGKLTHKCLTERAGHRVVDWVGLSTGGSIGRTLGRSHDAAKWRPDQHRLVLQQRYRGHWQGRGDGAVVKGCVAQPRRGGGSGLDRQGGHQVHVAVAALRDRKALPLGRRFDQDLFVQACIVSGAGRVDAVARNGRAGLLALGLRWLAIVEEVRFLFLAQGALVLADARAVGDLSAANLRRLGFLHDLALVAGPAILAVRQRIDPVQQVPGQRESDSGSAIARSLLARTVL